MSNFGNIVSGKIAMPVRLNASMVWNAIESAPIDSYVGLFVDGVRESSATTVREVVAESANIENLCNNSDRSFTLYVRGVNEWQSALIKELCSCYGEAIWHPGLTDGAVRCDIFAGEYAVTPGGIHREHCWNRHLVVRGEKRFFYWDHADLRANDAYNNVTIYSTENGDEEFLSTTSTQDIVSSALEIRATSGYYVHWPGWVWHVAEAPSPCLAVNIASHGLSSTGSIPGPIQTLPIRRNNEGELSAEWVAEYREFAPRFRDAELNLLVSAVSAGGLICPRLQIGEDIQDIRTYSAACRITNAPAVWVRDDDWIVVGLAGQATVIPSNGEDGVRWLGSGTSESYRPRTSGDFALLKWLHSIDCAKLLP